MPIASLVITLDDRVELRRCALSRLVAETRVDLGVPRGAFLPVVVDTVTPEEGEALVESLLATPGVLRVDVVGIDFSLDALPASPSAPSAPSATRTERHDRTS